MKLWWVAITEKPVKSFVWTHRYVVMAGSEAEAEERGRAEHTHGLDEYEAKVVRVEVEPYGEDARVIRIGARSTRVRKDL